MPVYRIGVIPQLSRNVMESCHFGRQVNCLLSFLVMRTFKIYVLSNFEIYDTELL